MSSPSPAPAPADPSPPAATGPAPAASAVPSARRRFWLVAGGLGVLCFILRAIQLMALPIFGDESIYLRWAQVIRGEGVAWGSSSVHLWVSLADPKPPLHFWLMAAVFHWTSDPLLAARLISVLSAAACVPAMMALGCELGHWMRPRDKQIGGWGLGIAAAVLGIFCPFLAFYQRLATADALFVTESLLIVWLSLRWARLAFEKPRRRSWLAAAALGAAIGAGLLTRQGVSYTICAMPVFAWLARLSTRLDSRAKLTPEQRGISEEKVLRYFAVGAAQLACAAVIAAALWTPFLTAQLHDWALALNHEVADNPEAQVTNGELLAEVKRRVFYQASFTQGGDGRLAIMQRNAFVCLVPGWDNDGNWNSGWFPLYMTPLVFGMCLAGLLYMAIRQRQMAFLLAVWLLLLIGPVVLLADTIYSRYVLAGVPPLLFAGAYLLGDTMAALRKARLGRVAAVVLWGVVLSFPAVELWKQAFAWRTQTLVSGGTYSYDFLHDAWPELYQTPRHEFGHRFPSDRYQYLTGWTAGYATRDAIAYLQGLARARPDKPVVIVTDSGWGTPADAVWVYLSLEPNVQVYFTDSARILRPGPEKGTWLLKDDKWLFPPERGARFADSAPIYLVVNDPKHADVDIPAYMFYKGANPNLRPPRTFYGIEGRRGEGVAVFEVPRQ